MQYLIFCLAYMVLLVGLLRLWERKQTRLAIRLPFTSDFRNGPGRTLHDELDKARADLMDAIFVFMILPFAGAVPFFSVDESQRFLVLVMLIPLGIATVYFSVRKLLKQIAVVRKLRLGYLGEVYVAQCLMPMVAKGYRLFHDYPGRDFNIDHIAVGPGGIFAVETKARMKPKRGGGTNEVRIVVRGDELHFPAWVDSKSIPQARHQAIWLSKQLTKEFGQNLPITPVLVVPGWFIEIEQKSDVLVCNGAEIERLVPSFGRGSLDREKLHRYVSHFIRACSYRPPEPGQKPA